jgi:hypothetical protein
MLIKTYQSADGRNKAYRTVRAPLRSPSGALRAAAQAALHVVYGRARSAATVLADESTVLCHGTHRAEMVGARIGSVAFVRILAARVRRTAIFAIG